ncbi:DNA cytosine methyltransferase [Sinomonas sp. JGH33]|uniref:DNA (cytosine-5-)-methyltransferase n=1 Tax=Sinomonas terricola TaxID=3110330 RepID=A0ABU5T0T1_9MICC|nr:DNA cytosine methyltransferase [Sinomonas sp. JGH33]MEA5453268.1 DNA cytosine methyltransferase [Sinomonas sp. JGH33]
MEGAERGEPTMKYGEVCSGYGGLSLAIEEAFPGAELAWYSEYEEAPSKIMAEHWPGVPNHGDMTAIDWAAVEPVELISGGTPCQDLSHAGRRRGMTEGTRSNLWVCMREAIAIIKPTYVVWENVRGAYSACADSEIDRDLGRCPRCLDPKSGARHAPNLRALGRVLGDLSSLGFDAEWRGLRAADVGAPHGRFRVFVLARRRD